MNSSKEIKIEKVTLNIGSGEAGDKLEKAVKLLNKISGLKPIKTKTMKRIPTWGIRPKLQIGCKVTIRGKKADELLKRLLEATRNILPETKFDREGNFAFGIPEYIDIPGTEYEVDIGIIGLDVAVTLKRAGFRIKRRQIKRTKIPRKHRITKEEAISFIKEKFNVEVDGEEK